ncbi:hypothetical protein BEWA_031170 [Theileria equi strain WA]|uniref:Bromo domain-containing protein n=1 Tax=Theileria equi strain WA TaxID=1537102 RepID=L0AZD2_THEEQ|nr:hypothetical protein BEWA_031170 [Theileria equi strain WA]AFZ80264.1 hypothetical protein BEWA_031170 [Theileria equi strain WA]|eukprot:XP_004829930.1 hypothetical protein BEWA_031170 [Theileria equi strain WA]
MQHNDQKVPLSPTGLAKVGNSDENGPQAPVVFPNLPPMNFNRADVPIPGGSPQNKPPEGVKDGIPAPMNAGDGQNWMMDGFYPMPMIPRGSFLPGGQMMPFAGDEKAKDGAGNLMRMEPGDDKAMQMCYYIPPPMMEPGKEGPQHMKPPMLMPMYPFMSPMPEDGMVMRDFGKFGMPNKFPPQRKNSDASEQVKSIPTSVQIREICQLKSWKKRLQKSKSQFRMDADASVTTKPAEEENVLEECATKHTAPQTGLALSKKQTRDLEVSWVINRFDLEDDLTEEDSGGFLLFDKDDLKREDVAELKKAIESLANVKQKCYPYQLVDKPTSFSKHVKKDGYSLWSTDEDFVSTCEMSSQDSAHADSSEETSVVPQEVPEEPASIQDDEFLDDLENELLDGLDDDKDVDDGKDLDDEFDFEVAETKVPSPSLPEQTKGPEEAVSKSPRKPESQLFGEVPDTVDYDNAKLVHAFHSFDTAHEWYKFRKNIDHELTLADFVEFDHHKRFKNDERVRNINKLFDLRLPNFETTEDPALMVKLYSTAKANLKFLLNYKHPEVTSLVNSSIYDLNASNAIYFMASDDIAPKVDELPTPSGTLTEQEDGTTPVVGQEEGGDEPLLQGKESDTRRQWRKRLQALDKETRLAWVNMGKSLKYIESVFNNIEQSRAYDSVMEFCEVASMFRGRDYINLLNQSFDDVYAKQNPHETGKDDEVLNRRELIHTRVAMNLTGILPLVGRSAKLHYARFHRMDFRNGLFNAHVRALKGNYSPEWSAWPVRPVIKSVAALNFRDDELADGSQNHPSNYFIHSSDLSLIDDCKVALFEYIEQYPLLLSNCGMVSRVDNYVNIPQEGGDQNMVSLGPLGTMIPVNDGVELFGIIHNIKPGEGQAVVENMLFKAPIFVHPRPCTSASKSNLTDTDFLLVRSVDKDSVTVRLRPLTWKNSIAVYTVGQCEPKMEISSPNSKSYQDDAKSLLKAWALKSIMTGNILDTKHLRKEARKKFYPALSEKEIGHVLKQLESNPIFSTRPQALERMIHSTIKPEVVCSLESTRAGRYRLKSLGISKLKNPDRIATVYAKIHQEEKEALQHQQVAENKRKELKSSYSKRLEARGITGPKLEQELNQFNIDLQCTIYGHLDNRMLSPQIRFIEELLKLSPWNITRDARQVLNNKGSAQFALYGFADPSGGRGEAINLLKRQVRDTSLENTSSGEDLRKLSMEELGKRLTRYGVSESYIKTLPRWDQVALVRQYRDGFGGHTSAEGDNRWRIPPEEYQKKLNDILTRQKEALLPDDPEISDEEDHDSNEGNQNIVDALMDEIDAESDKNDDLEMHELEILRQLREAQTSGPLSEEEKMAEDNKLKAVPVIMWHRQSRKTPAEPFGNGRAVFIYGEENIRKLLEWRKRTALKNKCALPSELIFGINAGGKRICRACGQAGHIASNPKCPLYSGDKVRHDTYHPSSTVAIRAGPGRKPFRDSDSSDGEIAASTTALYRDTPEWVLSNLNTANAREKRKTAAYEESDADSVDEASLVIRRRKAYRMYEDGSNINSRYSDDEHVSESKTGNIDTIMKVISKVVRMMEKESRYKPFAARIPESIAPNYYKIIKHPMWLALLKVRCKSKYYKSVTHFLNDLALIELNCKQYNSESSPNAWLRKMSEVLVDDILQRLQQMLSQHMPTSLLEYWIQEHQAKRGAASNVPGAPAGVVATTPGVAAVAPSTAQTTAPEASQAVNTTAPGQL